MNDVIKTVLVSLAVVAIGLGLLWFTPFGSNVELPFQSSPSPSPLVKETEFHEHFDLGVYVDGQWWDFSQEQYQSSTYDYLHEAIHLHDGNGTVVHLHQEGVSLQAFFETLGFELTAECLASEDQVWCEDEAHDLQVLVNGQATNHSQSIPLHDLDRILVWYGTLDHPQPIGLMNQVTDEACIYSETCPERGSPPVENCVASADQPCVATHFHEGEDESQEQ